MWGRTRHGAKPAATGQKLCTEFLTTPDVENILNSYMCETLESTGEMKLMMKFVPVAAKFL